jgi:hypothetical protein
MQRTSHFPVTGVLAKYPPQSASESRSAVISEWVQTLAEEDPFRRTEKTRQTPVPVERKEYCLSIEPRSQMTLRNCRSATSKPEPTQRSIGSPVLSAFDVAANEGPAKS